MKKNTCFLLVLLLATKCIAQTTDKAYLAHNAHATTLDSFINRKADSLLVQQQLPGIFIGVLNGGQRNYYNFGYAVPDQHELFDSTTLFEAGSITKTFTAYILLNVLQEKHLADSAFIIAYLPDSVKGNTALQPIRFLHLMNHTSGLPRMPENINPTVTNPLQPYEHYDTRLLFSYLKTAKPVITGKSDYSNLGAALAGILAERISGLSYAALLEKYITNPFALTSLYLQTPTGLNHKSTGYFNGTATTYWNMNSMVAAGGIQTTARDLLTYLQHIAIPDAAHRALVASMLTPTVALNEQVKIGRGWHTVEQKEKPVIYWHNGGTYGFSTFAAFLAGQNKAVIVVVNAFNKNQVSDGLGFSIINKLSEWPSH
jgi:CubicO group peptidase (beta-lactamase class C family)